MLLCMQTLETLKLRLISTPCMVLLEASLDATFTVATNASYVKIANVLCKIKEDVFNQSLLGRANLITRRVVILTLLSIQKLWLSLKP
jgi:hypothetical protein